VDRKSLTINVAGVGVLGVSGIAINFIVAKYYSPSVLGLFNQALAFFFITSQFAVGGVHFSTLQKIARCCDDRRAVSEILKTALVIVILLSTTVSALLWATSAYVAALFNSPDLEVGLSLVAISLVLFACKQH